MIYEGQDRTSRFTAFMENYKDAKRKNFAFNSHIAEVIGKDNVESIRVTYYTKNPQKFEFSTKPVKGSGILLDTTEELFGDVLITAGKYLLDIYTLIGFDNHSARAVAVSIKYKY